MTNPKHTLLGFIIDNSGSMERIKDDTEGGLQAFINEQKASLQEGETMECWLREFDTLYTEIYSRKPLEEVPVYRLTPRGATALLDSLHRFIVEVGADLNSRPEEERPGKVIMVVLTDGEENSSREITPEVLKDLIKQQEEVYSWDFTFLGANIDAVSVGASYGFRQDKALTYGANSAGVEATFKSMARMATDTRLGSTAGTAFTQEERAAAMGLPQEAPEGSGKKTSAGPRPRNKS